MLTNLHRFALVLLAAGLLPWSDVISGAENAAAAGTEGDHYALPGPYRAEARDVQWTDSARGRVLPLRLRLPDVPGPRPVVLFSHGLGGSVDSGRAWGEHWASHGFIVIHLQHAGSDESVWQGARNPAVALKSAADRGQFAARIADVKFVLDELQRRQRQGDAMAGRADLARVGLSGHSFGAITTQAIAGQRFDVPPWIRAQADRNRDARPRAFIGFSPSARSEAAVSPFATIERPFFSVTGTADGMVGLGLGVAPELRLVPFAGMSGPDKYLLILEGADHMFFNGGTPWRGDGGDPVRSAVDVRVTLATTTAFWLAYLANDADALA